MQTPYSHVVNVFVAAQLRMDSSGGGLIWGDSAVISCSRSTWRSARSGRSQVGSGLFLGATNFQGRLCRPDHRRPIPLFRGHVPDAETGGMSPPRTSTTAFEITWATRPRALRARYPLLSGCGGQTGRFGPPSLPACTHGLLGDSQLQRWTVGVRHAMRHGMQMEAQLHLLQIVDMGSDDERTVYSSRPAARVGSSFSAILNAWNPG